LSLKSEHDEKVKELGLQIDNMDARIKVLEQERETLSNDLAQLKEDYNRLKTTATTLTETVHPKEKGINLAAELYEFVLKDSKVPKPVLKGVGQFIDFRKYLGLAAERGAEEALKQAEGTLRSSLKEED
jgi:chromosome segregation ATPase